MLLCGLYCCKIDVPDRDVIRRWDRDGSDTDVVAASVQASGRGISFKATALTSVRVLGSGFAGVGGHCCEASCCESGSWSGADGAKYYWRYCAGLAERSE